MVEPLAQTVNKTIIFEMEIALCYKFNAPN